ncbi:hypothetical protein GCM10023189_20070 [Nibrella saemangeumensis]|uniref:histidine kinase n=1 Tax=Nibrella saemangeumensis TaxID=1084526 RepID=A0ABP8MPK7_9BACT
MLGLLLLGLPLTAQLVGQDYKLDHGLYEQGLVDLWEVWWFRLLPLMVLLIAVALFNYYTQRRHCRQMQQVLRVQEEERRRLAVDLHDDVGATLSVIKSELEAIPALRQDVSGPIRLIDKAIQDLRGIAHHLMPPEFMTLGLTEAIRETVKRAEARSGLACIFITYGEQQRLHHETELVVYRIALELISNAIRHANARQVTVQLIFYPNYVTLLVEDDSRGYPDPVQHELAGTGLRNIRSRVAFLNAKLLIDSGESGTTITLEIPIKKKLYGLGRKRYQHSHRRRPSAF